VENRGRKAVDVVVINTQHLRLKPPEYLNKHEAAIWSEVVNATDPQQPVGSLSRTTSLDTEATRAK